MASGKLPVQVSNNLKITRTQYTVECNNQASDAPNLWYGSIQLYEQDTFPKNATMVYAWVIGARINGKGYICYAGIQQGNSGTGWIYTLRATAPIESTVTVQVGYIYY